MLLLATSARARAEVAQAGGVRISVTARLSPKALPRHGSAPVAVAIGGHVIPITAGTLPQLRRIRIAINAHAHLETRGLPRCRRNEIQPSTSAEALATCRRALVGTGTFSSHIRLPEDAPFPSRGKILAFNGRFRGHPAILAHIYGTDPAPTSYVLPFTIRRSHGTYGAVLEAKLPPLTGDWGFVTGLSLSLGRDHAAPGAGYSYISAGCPAPDGLPAVLFPLAKTTFGFSSGLQLTTPVSRSCRVRR